MSKRAEHLTGALRQRRRLGQMGVRGGVGVFEQALPEESQAFSQEWFQILKQHERVQYAKMAILAAKSAYQFGSQRWLSLWSQAVLAIEHCPAHLQPHLMDTLCAFHPDWRIRP